MRWSWIESLIVCGGVIVLIGGALSYANAPDVPSPNIQASAPVIHLKDNLDEKDNLGFCLDTVGKGFSNRAQVHSCKANSSDLQFVYEAETGHIMSATFESLCLEIVPISESNVEFHLTACENIPLQNFTYEQDTFELHLTHDYTLCLGVEDKSHSEDGFMARNLELGLCEDMDEKLKQWVIVP